MLVRIPWLGPTKATLSGWNLLRICISDKSVPGNVSAAGPGATLPEALVRGQAEHERAFKKVPSQQKNSINIRAAYRIPRLLPSSGSPDDR